MERQRHVCVIDWFGVNYDGTVPTILLACDENWFALYAVWDIRYEVSLHGLSIHNLFLRLHTRIWGRG